MDSFSSPLSAFHSRPVPGPLTCREAWESDPHDRTAMILSLLIISGMILSYIPQFYRIIHSGSSEGFSAWFLLLGATSSASSLLNIVSLQWGQVECCQYLSAGQCFESVLGIGQVFFQWLCFNTIFVLYLVFYPPTSKYVRALPISASSVPPHTPFLAFFRPRALSASSASSASSTSSASFSPSNVLLPGQIRHATIQLSPSYRLALSLFSLTLLHLILSTTTTFILLLTLPGAPGDGEGRREHPSERAVRVWATTLGIAAVVLGCAQYAPQLVLTARRKLVGSLSIPMMCLQAPGSFLFVYTLAVRPGVNWTGYATYLVTGILQGCLLIMCIVWHTRQKRHGIDDWGNKIVREGEVEQAGADERTPLVR